jgi:hypothetical protein
MAVQPFTTTNNATPPNPLPEPAAGIGLVELDPGLLDLPKH